MKKSFQPKHLPIPIGLAFLIFSLISGVLLINRSRRFTLRASPQTSPQQVKITNIGNASFVVSWTTAEKTTGLISFGETARLGKIKNDVRDRDKNSLISSSIHFVLVDDLRPQVKYYFKIISGEKIYDNVGKPFEVTTAPPKNPPDHDIASGKILTSSGQPAAGVIVYLSLANTIPQAAITDNLGIWIISLSTSWNLDLTDFSSYDRGAQIEEILVKGDQETASATLTTGNDNPAPNIVLGQNYNFLNQSVETSAVPIPTSAGESGGEPPRFVPPTLAPVEEQELKIAFPAEGEEVNSQLPEFFGTGPKTKSINIEVKSEEKIYSRANIDQKGNWGWSPEAPLSPGAHEIIVSYTNPNGIVQKVSRSFIVLAEGESELPSFTATPSGQRTTPAPSPSPLPTPTTKIAKAALATATPKPTTEPTISPTPAETSQAPSSGVDLPTRLFLGVGAATLFLGVIAFLF